MPRSFLSCLMIAAIGPCLLFSPPSQAGNDHHRQHGAHEHGAAQLNIAVEDNTLHLELSSPAANIVGFEHKPRTTKQRQAVKHAIHTLKQAMVLFEPSASAKCQPGKTEVDAGALQDSHHHDEHHHHEGHADFSAHYVFQCARPDKLDTLQLRLFKHFPGIEELQLQLLTDSGQGAMTITANNATIKLK